MINRSADYFLTIVVPVYNEEESLPTLFTALKSYLSQASVRACVLFVNDGSADGSLALIKAACEQNTDFFYLSLQQRCGLTGALKAGFDHSASPWSAYIDADLQTFPEDFELLLPHVGEAELICGIRAKRHDSWSKKMQSKIANKIRNAVTHDGFSDTNCPLKIIDSSLARKLPLFSGMHRFLPALTLLFGKRVYAVPVRHQERRQGKSKFNLFNRGLSGLCDLFAFVWMRRRFVSPQVGQQNLCQEQLEQPTGLKSEDRP